MLDSHNLPNSVQIVLNSKAGLLAVFTVSKAIQTIRSFFLTMEKSFRLIPDYLVNRPKDFCNCAAIYVAIATLMELVQGKTPEAQTLVTSALVGGFISPFVIPWVRAFPLTGNPAYTGMQRVLDFGFNITAHFLSLTVFVWALKVGIAVGSMHFIGDEWEIPGLFEASLAFVIVNNFRKVATEYLGINVLIFRHPQGREEIQKIAAKQPHFNAEQCRLAAWNAWREVGNGYAFWKSSKEKPIGVQYWIALSKTLDSIAILF